MAMVHCWAPALRILQKIKVSIHPSTLSNIELLYVHLFPILNFLTYLTATGIWPTKNTQNSYINTLGLELTADIGLRSLDFEANSAI
jgi:hypothetical protein